VDIGLPFGLGVEVDALYRREGYQTAFSNAFGYSVFSDERANSWEFPMLAKYRIPFAAVKPFVEVGYAPRVINGSVSSTSAFPTAVINPSNGSVTSGGVESAHAITSTNWPVSHGLVVGGGVQFGMGRLRLSPTVRYTHWNNMAISGYYGDGPSWQSTRNQFDVLLNIGWKVR
jgi:hypothetical protein